VGYVDQKVAPKREERLGATIVYGGSGCELKKQFAGGCLKNQRRSFCQGSICQLMPGFYILNSISNAVAIVHGSVGCGGSMNSNTSTIRSRQLQKGAANPPGALWLSTNLTEKDVVNGGEAKLEQAILAADRRYRPEVIFIVSSCVPGVIGDDIDSVAERLQPQVGARILPVHCEGFKTDIMASSYDAIYHSIARNLLEPEAEEQLIIKDELAEAKERIRRSRLVNLFNVTSMTAADEQELTRLLNALELEVQIMPCFTDPEQIKKSVEAALSISTCPTHDDYFAKHLQKKYGIPYILRYMPIGMANTNQWLREVAKFFQQEETAERIIARENQELLAALTPFRETLVGKKVMLSAGEVRSLATALWLKELGMEVVAVRIYHYDEFGAPALDQLLAEDGDLPINVATVHPFETVNLLQRFKPDLYLGHSSDNAWAAKLGIPTLPIYGGSNVYVGYAGAFDIARRLSRKLINPIFNRKVSKNYRQPYHNDWYDQDAFAYILTGGGDAQ
jgi:nitrogenase molybdenum-iron protein alpha chain